jgi:hypothetical protein
MLTLRVNGLLLKTHSLSIKQKIWRNKKCGGDKKNRPPVFRKVSNTGEP